MARHIGDDGLIGPILFLGIENSKKLRLSVNTRVCCPSNMLSLKSLPFRICSRPQKSSIRAPKAETRRGTSMTHKRFFSSTSKDSSTLAKILGSTFASQARSSPLSQPQIDIKQRSLHTTNISQSLSTPWPRKEEFDSEAFPSRLRALIASGRNNEAFWSLIRSNTALISFDKKFVSLVSEIVAKRGLVKREYMDPIELTLWLDFQQAIPNSLAVELVEDLLARKRPYEAVMVALSTKCFLFPSNTSRLDKYPVLEKNSGLSDAEAIRLVRALGTGMRLVDDPVEACFCFETLIKLEPLNVANYLELLGIWMTPRFDEENAEKALQLITNMPSNLQRNPEVLQYKMQYLRLLRRYKDVYEVYENRPYGTGLQCALFPLYVCAKEDEHYSDVSPELRSDISEVINAYLNSNTGSILATVEVARLAKRFPGYEVCKKIVNGILRRGPLTLREVEHFFYGAKHRINSAEIMHTAIEAFNHSIPMRKEMAEYCLRVHDFDKALSLYRDCMSSASSHPSLLVKVALCLEGLQQYKEAQAALHASQRFEKPLHTFAISLRLLLKMGDFDNAEMMYNNLCESKRVIYNENSKDDRESWRQLEVEWGNCIAGNFPIDGPPRLPTPKRLYNPDLAMDILKKVIAEEPIRPQWSDANNVMAKLLDNLDRTAEANQYRSYEERR